MQRPALDEVSTSGSAAQGELIMEEKPSSLSIRKVVSLGELWRWRSWSVPQLVDSRFCSSSCSKVAVLVLFLLVFVIRLVMQSGLVDTYNSLSLMERVFDAENIFTATKFESGSSDTMLRAASSSSDYAMIGLRRDPAARCLSRSQHMLHRPASQIIPSSPDLISALSAYEKRHVQCLRAHGQNWTETFLRSLNGTSLNTSTGCQFLIYIEGGAGLGNRLISLISAFVFALFTNRVLLLDSSETTGHVASLLCEPFTGSSWILPPSFPLDLLWAAPNLNTAVSNGFDGVASVLTLNLDHAQNWGDQRFFCSETRQRIQEIEWVSWTSNQYLVPRLLTFPEFWPRLSTVFPNPSHVFTHLSRYLLLPSNSLWEKIFRIYSSYLSSADKLVGIQIRRHSVPDSGEYSQLALERALDCLMNHRILPNVSWETTGAPNKQLLEWMTKTWVVPSSRRSIHPRRQQQADVTTVLVASLQQRYVQELQDLYTNFPTADGSLVRVHMVSHEGMEWHSYDQAQKAFVEMWLLSFSSSLATSSWSTFGYVAQGLGALRPYIVNLRGDLDPNLADHMHDPDFPHLHCVVGQSPEPCNHYSFWPKTDCGNNQSSLHPAHEAWVEKHLGSCQDEISGHQLVLQRNLNQSHV